MPRVPGRPSLIKPLATANRGALASTSLQDLINLEEDRSKSQHSPLISILEGALIA